MKIQQQVGHNHEVEQHLLDISNFFNKSKTEKLGPDLNPIFFWGAELEKRVRARRPTNLT